MPHESLIIFVTTVLIILMQEMFEQSHAANISTGNHMFSQLI